MGVLEIENGGAKNMTSSFHVVIHSYIDLIKGGRGQVSEKLIR